MKIIEGLKQGSAEWKAFRRFKIGASDAAAILGISPWKSPLQLWEEKIKGIEQQETVAMSRGKDLEPKARDFFNKLLKANFSPMVCEHDAHDWMIASLDGVDTSINALVEIKCSSKISEEIPKHYYAQMQHQFAVTGLEKGFYFEFIEGEKYQSIAIERDEAYIKKLIGIEQSFYQSLLDFKPPAATARDEVEYTDSSLVQNANKLASLQSQIDLLQADYDELKKQIVAKCEHPKVKIGLIKLNKIIRKGVIEYEKIPELKDVNLENYRKKSIETWRVTLNG